MKSINKIKKIKERRNLVSCFVDDLIILDENPNYEFIGFSEDDNNTITLKIKNIEAFNMIPIMSIIGYLMPFGKLKLNTKVINAENPLDDVILIKFSNITRKGNLYKGFLKIVKRIIEN